MVMHKTLASSQGHYRNGSWAASCSDTAIRGLGWLWVPSGWQIPVVPEVPLPGFSPHFTLCPWVCYILCVTRAGIRSSQLGDITQEKGNFWSQLQGRGGMPRKEKLLAWVSAVLANFFCASLLPGQRKIGSVCLGGPMHPRDSVGQPTCCTWRWVGCWTSQDALGVLLCTWPTWPGGRL